MLLMMTTKANVFCLCRQVILTKALEIFACNKKIGRFSIMKNIGVPKSEKLRRKSAIAFSAIKIMHYNTILEFLP